MPVCRTPDSAMKRSKTTALLLMGAAPLLFTACEPGPPVGQPSADTVQEGLYTSVDRCAEATGDAATCQAASDHATRQAADAAPQYATRAECERDYPADQCAEQRTTAGHSFIGPLMAGFFLSQMMNGNRAGAAQQAQRAQATPAFRDNTNGWLRSTGAPAAGAGAAAGRAGLTPVAATPDRATTVNRGGFGTSGRNRSSAGG